MPRFADNYDDRQETIKPRYHTAKTVAGREKRLEAPAAERIAFRRGSAKQDGTAT
ncbi:MAG: hypothetical protein VB106_01825 [Clostridiaceae bacterium]|nr:hypothetical protein [Clostridiaceae bacterium]